MTYQNDFTLSAALLEQLTTSGFEALPALFQVLLNAAMQIERQNHLGAAPHERTEERTGHANGFKNKTLCTQLGQIAPNGDRSPSRFRRCVRSTGKAAASTRSRWSAAHAPNAPSSWLWPKCRFYWGYVQGVSTRKVAAITEKLCGFAVSSGQVSAGKVYLTFSQ